MRLGLGDGLRALGWCPERQRPLDGWIGRNAYFNLTERRELWLEPYRHLPQAHTETFLKERFNALKGVRAKDLIDTVQGFDIMDYLPYNNLHKVDIASMCHGLEVRVPLLDHELAAFAMRIPWKQRMRPFESVGRAPESAMHGYVNKYPLRRVAEKTFGYGFFDRKKQGFAMPIGHWLARDECYALLEAELLERGGALLQYFERDAIARLLRRHRQQQDQGLKLWALWFLVRWFKEIAKW